MKDMEPPNACFACWGPLDPEDVSNADIVVAPGVFCRACEEQGGEG